MTVSVENITKNRSVSNSNYNLLVMNLILIQKKKRNLNAILNLIAST